jgi:hypothetical protein
MKLAGIPILSLTTLRPLTGALRSKLGRVRRFTAMAVAAPWLLMSANVQAQSLEKACIDYVLSTTWADEKKVLQVRNATAVKTGNMAQLSAGGLNAYAIQLHMVGPGLLMARTANFLCVAEAKAVLGRCGFDPTWQFANFSDPYCPSSRMNAALRSAADAATAPAAAATPAAAASPSKSRSAAKTAASDNGPSASAARCIGNRRNYVDYNDCIAFGSPNTPGYCSRICN